MFVILGFTAVLGAIFGGYVLAGGHLGALWQPVELLMIGGGAVGAFIVGNNAKAIKATLWALPDAFKGSRYTKVLYMDLLAMLYEILNKVRRDGIMSIENDIENPEASALFTKYPRVLADRHLIDFLTDYLRLMVSGNLDAYQIENLMDNEIETHHMEGFVPVHCIARMGDGLPAFGIIAAVMGVVHTMENVALPPAELGVLIARALVGTFLGILLAYGLINPLSGLLEQKLEENTKLLQTIKVTLLASLNGYAPAIAIEFGRKVLYSSERPAFDELEDFVKQKR